MLHLEISLLKSLRMKARTLIGDMETCRFGERVWKTHLCLEELLIAMMVAHFC